MTQDQTLKSALETIAESVVIWSSEGKAVYASQSFLDAFDLHASEVEGRDRRSLETTWSNRGVITLSGLPHEEIVTRKGRHFERHSTPLPYGGQCDQFRDLSLREEAKKTEKFLGIVIHDLRAPLANVRSYSSLLLGRHQVLDPKVKRSVEVITRNADRALRLLQLFFDSVRAQTGELEVERQPVNLPNLVQEIVTTLRPNAAEKGVEIKVSFPENTLSIAGDGPRLRYALAAFLDFSIARSPPNQAVELHGERQSAQVKLKFTDFGPLLNTEQRRTIFDPIEQALREKRLGTGFAVAVAHSVVQVHGGRAEIESAPSQSSFSIFFPR
jgi:signal transduction histidine kinase